MYVCNLRILRFVTYLSNRPQDERAADDLRLGGHVRPVQQEQQGGARERAVLGALRYNGGPPFFSVYKNIIL
jgi:hypothetical protein